MTDEIFDFFFGGEEKMNEDGEGSQSYKKEAVT